MEMWLLILSTLCYTGAASAHATAGSDPFLDNSQYLLMYQELRQCSIPSSRMFARSMDSTGHQRPSTFDVFCYYGGRSDNVAHFMCLYYKQIVETYFKAYCEDNSPLKKPLDESAQYKNFASNLQEVASYLATNLIAGGGQPVFQSADQCFQYCQTSEQSKEFCVNFGFVLKTALSITRTELAENQLQGTTTSGVVEKQTANTDRKDTARTEGENYPQGTAPFVYEGFIDTTRIEKNQPESTTRPTLESVEQQKENRFGRLSYWRIGEEWTISDMLSRQMVCFVALSVFLIAISFFLWKSEKRLRKRHCDVSKNKSEKKPPSIAYIHVNTEPE